MRLQAWQKAKPARTLILVPGDDAPDPQLTLASSCSPESCGLIWQYLRQGGVGNGINLLRYLHQECHPSLATQTPASSPKTRWKPPAQLPQALIYQPGIAQASLTDWQKDTLTKGLKDAPVVALLFYRSHLQSGNTRMFDGLMASLIAQGMNPIALAVTSLKDPQALALVNHTIKQSNPKSVTVFLDTCYSGVTRNEEMLIAGRPIVIKAKEQAIPDGFTLFSAASNEQISRPLEEAKHGMFSYFLMKGMEGDADSNNDNKITARELHAYVKQNVTQQSSGSQTPELQGDKDRVLVQFN